MYVMSVTGGIEPELSGPYSDEEALRLAALRLHAAQDPDCDAVFVLAIDAAGRLHVETYGSGITAALHDSDLEDGPHCGVCGELAGPDYHLTAAGGGGENPIACPDCWDERLR